MNDINIGEILTLKELENERFIVSNRNEGGFGFVYYLKSLSGKYKESVIKILKNDGDEIIREALLWSKIGYHKNIAEFICIGNINNQKYILSPRYEYILSDIDITKYNVEEIFIGIIDGLYYANNQLGLIHRDIKPSNIFYDNYNPKIGDFGISAYNTVKYILDKSLKNINSILIQSIKQFGGTPLFMAPELFSINSKCNVATDIYSIGITMFYILSEHNFPYNLPYFNINTNSYNVFKSNCKNTLLCNIIEKCIQLDPNRRYKKYEEIYNDMNINISKYNNTTDLYSRISYIQTLRRTNQIERAIDVINNCKLDYQEHPLLVNQEAIIKLVSGDEKGFEKILLNLHYNEKMYTLEEYLDPICNLCGYYFEKKKYKNIIEIMEYYENIFDKNAIYKERYIEYSIYLYYVNRKEEAYQYMNNIIKNTSVSKRKILLLILSAYETDHLESIEYLGKRLENEYLVIKERLKIDKDLILEVLPNLLIELKEEG